MGMDIMYDVEEEGITTSQELSVIETETGELEPQELAVDIDLDLPNDPELSGSISLATWLFYLIAMIAALGTSVYAFLEPSDSSPEDVSEEWWDALPLQTKILSIATAVDTQIVYTIFFSFFVESAFWRLKESLGHCFNSCREFAINALTIFFGGYAALANADIIYAGFLWLPFGELTSLFPALFNYTVVFASRYVGLGQLIHRIMDYFDSDARFKEEVLYCLEHIRAEYQGEVNHVLEDKPCDETGLVEVIDFISTRQNAISPRNAMWYLKETLGTSFDLGFSLTIFISSFMLFAQKGFDGVELMTHNGLKDANPLEKIALGVVPGVISAIFMALNAYDFRKVMLRFAHHLRHYPCDIALGVIALFMNILTAFSSWRHVAGSTLTPDNIFFLTNKNSPLGQAYMYINSVGSCVVTFKPMCLKIMESKAPVTPLDGMIGWVQNNRISSDTVDKLRRHSFFGEYGNRSLVPQLSSREVIEEIEVSSP